MINTIKGQIFTFLKYKSLLKKLVIRDIKVRYRKSFLGLIWTVLNPLLMMCVISLVFSNLFKTEIENYPVYVLLGMIVFNCNSEATNQALISIVDNAALIKKIYIPKYLFPVSKVISSLVNLGFSFVALLIVMLVTGAPFRWNLILVIIPTVYLLMFSVGLSLILASVNVYFRDMTHLYSGVLITAWTYLTPIFYTISIVPKNMRGIMQGNPMYHYVTFFRNIIMDGIYPGLNENLYCFSLGLGMLLIGIIVFKRLQDNFILHM